MIYLCKFDDNGRRGATYPEDATMSAERKAELIADGFLETSEEDWKMYCDVTGGVNGTGYIRDAETGKPIDAPSPPLDTIRAEKIRELKGIRDTKEVEPIQTDKGLFDYDDKSRDRLQIARQALIDGGGEGKITWTTADNQRVPLGVPDFAAINDAAAVRSNALHVTYNELKERVNAAKTEAEVKAIEWPEDKEVDVAENATTTTTEDQGGE